MVKLKPLSEQQLAHFVEEGYLVARGLLDYALDIAPVIAEYEVRLDEVLASWYEAGLIADTWEERRFSDRLIQIVSQTDLDYSQPLDIALPLANITETTPMHTGPAIFSLLRSSRLLDAVEQFIGPEIYSNPVQHVRIKPPMSALPKDFANNSLITHTPWHQDMGVIHEEADESNILTVWIAITEATEENGCMAVVPRSHKGQLALHCPIAGQSVTIPEARIPGKPLSLPMQPGDVLFMTSTTMHTSLKNVSESIRWSFDLRYNPIGEKTGRPWFPGFVARSQQHPELELHDAERWSQLWDEARLALARQETPAFTRWSADAVGCA
ncbi:MAG: phytanoyl-CoA dioxygenase family protein [Chloroflexota bacterium]